MMLKEYKEALLQFLFPHVCMGCGSDVIDPSAFVCLQCLYKLPYTGFENEGDNPVEKIFWGRLPVQQASAIFYYTRASLMQKLVRQIKYRGDSCLCFWLGTIMGSRLISSDRFIIPEVIVPLPLHPSRKLSRGFNQAEILANGVASVLHLPVLTELVLRPSATSTQTRKGRTERWQNMEGRFQLADSVTFPQSLLLIDDVLTTGATLESCGKTLMEIPGLHISIATLCFAAGN